MEKWEPISGYDGIYEVSDIGRVRHAVTGHIKRPYLHPSGYLFVFLYRVSDKSNKMLRVHRLVADAFIHKLPERDQVNHINGNKADNRAANLEWVDGKENTQHAISIGHFSCKRVIDSYGNIYESTRDVERKTGINSSAVSRVCRGIYRQYKGMKFFYLDEIA